MLAAGDQVPDLRLESLELDSVSAPVLLAFFKITCPTCQLIFPYLQRLADRGGPAIVGLSQDDRAGTDEFNGAFGVRLPTLVDPAKDGYRVSNAFGIDHVPSLFLVEPGGRISWAGEGFARQALESLAARWNVTLFDPADRVPVYKPG